MAITPASILFEGRSDRSLESLNHESADRNEHAEQVESERRKDRDQVTIRGGPGWAGVAGSRTRFAAIATQAGDDRDVALFSVRASSTWLEAVPDRSFPVEAPSEGEAVVARSDLRPAGGADGDVRSPRRGETWCSRFHRDRRLSRSSPF